MAPFSQAISSSLARTEAGGTTVYVGAVDDAWSIGFVPHGGYILAIITNACIQFQAETKQRDPLHVTTHYLKASQKGAFEVRVRRLREGKSYSNITAELVQGSARVVTHWIFGTQLPPSPATAQDPGDVHIPPSSTFYKRHPLPRPPSSTPKSPLTSKLGRAPGRVNRAREPAFDASNTIEHYNKDVGLQLGMWFELMDDEVLTYPALAYFADMNLATPVLLPDGYKPETGSSWFPTLSLTLQFLAPIPKPKDGFAPGTVGLYQRGSFVSRPDSRHEEYVEIWSAPESLGGGTGRVDEGWRDKQVCFCVATQMALVVPAAVNRKLGSKL